MIALKMDHISKRFAGIQALNDVSIEIEKGKVNAIVGENGAGKSTLMKILTGVVQKDSGTVKINGQVVDIKNTKEAINAGIAMIYQELNLVPYLSVAENIFLGREDTRAKVFVDKKQQINKAKALLKSLNIDVPADAIVNTLTVAKQQMIEIAKALYQNSKILIMDEPTSSLTNLETNELFKKHSGADEKRDYHYIYIAQVKRNF